MLVLLVDDEQSLLDIFSQTLIAGGMQVVTASNGKDGFDKAKTQKPDIVLLDQVLPDMNGNQVLQLLKKDPETKNIPVAMLSNFTQNGLVDEAINAGALDYILKYQIEPKDLIAKVNDLIREHSSTPGIADDKVSFGNSTPASPDEAPEAAQPAPAVEPIQEPAMVQPQTVETTPQPQPKADEPLAQVPEITPTPVETSTTPIAGIPNDTPTPAEPDTAHIAEQHVEAQTAIGQSPTESGQVNS